MRPRRPESTPRGFAWSPSRHRRARSRSGPSASAGTRGSSWLLHGGPGATHEYFEGLETFLAADGIEFIYYDQLGSAYSDQPKDESLWTIERFLEEVEQVRQALGLTKDDFYLFGQSWGGILATEYALVREIKEVERKGQYESPRYMELLVPHFYMKHICRLEEWPDALVRSFGKLNKQVYVLMQGPSEFGASGRLERWDRKADLGKITVPTLVIGAAHDSMDPEHMRWVSTQVKSGSFLLCPKGRHLATWDDQRAYASGLVRFLKAVDEGKATVVY